MLAGGAGRRFGPSPKGLAIIGGERIVDRVARALAAVTDELLLVANDPDARHWLPGVEVRRDAHTGGGGLAGVHAALQKGGDVLAVAWDMPFVTPELLGLIRDVAWASDAEVCVPESASPHGVEPFCALYRASVTARLDTFLKSGGGAAHEFLARCAVHRIPQRDIRRLGDPDELLLSVNTPEELRRARDRLDVAR